MDIYEERFKRTKELLKKEKLDAVIVTSPSNFFYYTGIWLDSHERLQAIVISEEMSLMIVHEMSKEQVKNQVGIEKVYWQDGDEAVEILAYNLPKVGTIAIDNNWSSINLIHLHDFNQELNFKDSTNILGKARLIKDEVEVSLLEKSGALADSVMNDIKDFIKSGITEKEVANEIKRLFKEKGASDLSFETIVGFGKNSAIPHHETGDTTLKEGDTILIDMGGIRDYYCSDMTRTFVYKKVSPKIEEIYNIVKLAQEETIKKIKPGMRMKDADAIARDIITKAGYGENFTHRTGHGLGIEIHEEPFLTSKNEKVLEEGMVVSVEPGIYLPGEFGVRIEDIIVIKNDGAKRFNNFSKELICLD